MEVFSKLTGNHTVSNAGDVNNDGYDDVIVGEFYNAGSNRAYIYFGGEEMDNEPDVIFEGEYPDDSFGGSVSDAGDVNNDGYSDVIVGAYTNDCVDNNAGAAYLFYGGNPMDNIPDLIFTGEEGGDFFGYSVSSAGDVNKDGHDDVIVGAYANGQFLTDRGKAYIYFGGNSMDNISNVVLTGQNDYQFGFSVSSAGDVNNDGYYDVIVGEPSFDDNDPGWAHVFFGGNPMDNVSDVILIGQGNGDRFGWSVTDLGDVNNDTYSDFIVGAPKNDSGGSSSGAAYLYFGGDPIDNVSDIIFFAKAYDSAFGFSVSGGGDINNDGIDDIIIGAYENRTLGNSKGAVYLYFGDESPENITEFIIEGSKPFESFGISVSIAGDINNDNYSDIIMAAKDFSYIYGFNLGPSLSIIKPDGLSDNADYSYNIEWIDDDPDDDATISLYYCVQISDNPILIQGANGISEDDENDTFIWDTSNVASGSYYIKSKIDDGINPEVWVYSPGKVTINHHPIIIITAPGSSNNNADESFPITWIDHDDEDNATISIFYDTDNFGNDGILIASDIGEDDSTDIYAWNTTNIPDGQYYIYAEIDDGINPIYTNYSSIPLTIHHKMPNLSIQHIGTTPLVLKIGEKVIFNMTLINTGDKAAQDCVVELFIDDVLMGEVAVNEVLPNNGTYNFIFEPFTIKTKIHSLFFRVKMQGEEVETWELTVKSQDKDELDLIFVLIPILLLVLIIVLLFVFLIRRKQLGDKSQTTGIDSTGIPISCPSCSFSFNIPSEPRPLQIQCPNCGTKGTMK